MSNAEEKIARVRAALEGRETDRVPIGEFFWSNFTANAARVYAGGGAFHPYRHWDLDLIVITPNMDPHMSGIEILTREADRTVVRTGFEAVIELRPSCPMPRFVEFGVNSYEDMETFRFDDPRDLRRFTARIDDQINSVGDALNLGLPSFVERVDAHAADFCVFGSVCDPYEMLWRIIGAENALIKLAEEPEKTAAFVARLGDFLVAFAEAQIEAARGTLEGLYIWGDVAYDRGMFFAPSYWREVFKPVLVRLCAVAHRAGLKTIYHGCGNASVLYDDMIEAGVDAYNPLEAKAGLDVVALKRRFGHRWAFNGNLDVRVLTTNDRARVTREVLTKLNAAKGGGYIVQSDHSIPGAVAPETYDLVVSLVKEYGRYPLRLGEFDVDVGG